MPMKPETSEHEAIGEARQIVDEFYAIVEAATRLAGYQLDCAAARYGKNWPFMLPDEWKAEVALIALQTYGGSPNEVAAGIKFYADQLAKTQEGK
jgi:hypothetical protein